MIRKANENDIPRILELLTQVNDVHAEGRPDFFIKGQRKYNEDDLLKIINDDTTPVFVYVGTRLVTSESETQQVTSVQGYAFCVMQDLSSCNNLRPDRSLYIDDICVDEKYRRSGVGKELYEYVIRYAKEQRCFNVTLNVWAKNPGAQAFYESMGMTVQKVCMEKVI